MAIDYCLYLESGGHHITAAELAQRLPELEVHSTDEHKVVIQSGISVVPCPPQALFRSQIQQHLGIDADWQFYVMNIKCPMEERERVLALLRNFAFDHFPASLLTFQNERIYCYKKDKIWMDREYSDWMAQQMPQYLPRSEYAITDIDQFLL